MDARVGLNSVTGMNGRVEMFEPESSDAGIHEPDRGD
jgi:hypothetical protein